MNSSKLPLCVLAFAAGLFSTSLRAEEVWGKATDNKIYIQQLVDQLVAKNSDLYIVGVHATPPNAKEQTMVACNLDRIGKADHIDDLEVTSEHRTSLNQKQDDPKKFTVMTPLKEADGMVIGALVLIFNNYQPHETEEKYYLRAMKIRDDLAKAIPTQAAMFKPTK